MTDYTTFFNNWLSITINNLITFSLILILVLIVIFILGIIDPYLFRANRPRKFLDKGYGGVLVTFRSVFYIFFIVLAYYLIGASLLAPFVSFFRSFLTDQLYPINYYTMGAWVILVVIWYYFLNERYKKFMGKNNYFFIGKNNILIIKFYYQYGFIPLKHLKSIHVDKENILVKFIFKTKIFGFLSLTPRWIFEFDDRNEFDTLIQTDLQEYTHLFIKKHLKRNKRFKGIPLRNKISFEIVQHELPTPIVNIFR